MRDYLRQVMLSAKLEVCLVASGSYSLFKWIKFQLILFFPSNQTNLIFNAMLL